MGRVANRQDPLVMPPRVCILGNRRSSRDGALLVQLTESPAMRDLLVAVLLNGGRDVLVRVPGHVVPIVLLRAVAQEPEHDAVGAHRREIRSTFLGGEVDERPDRLGRRDAERDHVVALDLFGAGVSNEDRNDE